jgi:two-component system sensor histidine kinase RegB
MEQATQRERPLVGDLELRWLIRLRFGALAAQTALLVLIWLSTTWTIDWRIVGAVFVVGIASNVVLMLVAQRRRVQRLPLFALLLDVALLTVLLVATGGPMNPFTLLYLVQVALASVTLASSHAWIVTITAVCAYAGLFVVVPTARHDHAHMALHLQGMWIATLVAGVLIAFFVSRLRRDLAARAAQERRLHALEARNVRLASLATLAGGAAHELATPLSSIALAAEDIHERVVGDERDAVELILREVMRCKRTLENLAARGGAAAATAPERVTLRALVDDALREVSPERIVIDDNADLDSVVEVPRSAFVVALVGLMKNALYAGGKETPVHVRAGALDGGLVLDIHDRGPRVAGEVLERIGEPFFTTKPLGSGMGLGVFLARSMAERMGGALEFIVDETGTTVRVSLPHADHQPMTNQERDVALVVAA